MKFHCVEICALLAESLRSFLGVGGGGEEDILLPSTRKVQGETTFRVLCMKKFWSGWLPRREGKDEILLAFSS